jgi:hypothetical protein
VGRRRSLACCRVEPHGLYCELMTDANALHRRYRVSSEEEDFVAFVTAHFDAAYYLSANGDVAQAGVDPLEHWLNSGVKEGRQISKSTSIRFGKIAKRSSDRNWTHYRWLGDDVAVRLINPIPPEILTQISNQARHDPAIRAALATTIVHRGERESNLPVDVAGLRRAIPREAEYLFLVPRLTSEQTLAADIIAVLCEHVSGNIQTIVTDQESSEGDPWPDIPGPFRSTNIAFWPDFVIYGPEFLRMAQLVRILRPRVTVIAESRAGREMVAQFGRTLSQSMKLYCVYTGADEASGPDACFPRRTLPFAAALTDDPIFANKLREDYGDFLGHNLVALPAGSKTQRSSTAEFKDAVIALFERT